MAAYGRNFDCSVSPTPATRGARFYATGLHALGAPGIVNTALAEIEERSAVDIAVGAQAPKKGAAGAIVYEFSWDQDVGADPFLTTYSDNDAIIQIGTAVQLVSGVENKVVYTNTFDRHFLVTKPYAGRLMVAGLSGLAVGDMLTPGAGTDSGGYWQKTTDASLAWLRITAKDAGRNRVECQFLF